MQDVDQYLDSYLSGHSDPGTAVLLVGHWGSGKTHYIRSYFRRMRVNSGGAGAEGELPDRGWWRRRGAKATETERSTEPVKFSGHLYASFFGAESSAGISDQFLSQLYPKLNSTLGKVLGAAAIRLAGVGAQLASAGTVTEVANDEDARAIRDWLSNPKGRVLVFDDLERASIPIEQCLSIINSYVERDELKVIVLANEDELVSNALYARWKEKVIGKTIQVLSDPLEVLEALAQELDAGPVRSALEEDRAEILAVMAAFPSVNYRSVRSLAFDVQRIVSILDGRLGSSRAGVLQLLKFSVAVGSEFRAGRIDASDVKALQQSLIIRIKDKEKRTDHDKYLLDLEERFSLVGALDSVVPAQNLVKYWRVGSLDVHSSNGNILKHPAIVGEACQPPWQRLWELRKLKEEGFKSAQTELVASLNRQEIIAQGELLHLVGIALTLEDYDTQLFPDHSDANEWIRDYAGHPNVLCRLERTASLTDGREAYGGFGYHKVNDSRFREASEILEELVAAAEQARLRSSVPRLLDEIAERKYDNIYAFDGSGDACGVAWLHMVDVSEMADIMLSDGSLRPLLTNLMIRRHSEDAQGRLRAEWRWARRLRDELLKRARLLPAPFRFIAAESIVDAAKKFRVSLRHTISVTRQHKGLKGRRPR